MPAPPPPPPPPPPLPPPPLPPPPARSDAPFVLLDDASPAARGAMLYRDPAEVVIARTSAEVEPALARLDRLHRAGRHLAGYFAYEAGLALEPRLAPLAASRCGADGPLVWFGAFDACEAIEVAAVPEWLAQSRRDFGPARIGPMEPQVSQGEYLRAFAAMQSAIVAGDIYQANLTFPLAGSWRGDPLALYAGLRRSGGGAHGGVIFDGAHWLLSLSPELFFAVDAGTVTARPMKGTAPRGRTVAEDAALKEALVNSGKDRAENLMIVDLMRNDLSRVAAPGSVGVEGAFAIETYPSLHQMVSTVRGQLRGDRGINDLLRALFPCGSITGAPKIRAMELIAAHEASPRGAYCGAIGRIDPARDAEQAAGDAAFNVAIRTLRLTPGPHGDGRAVMGVGSAIVADSRGHAEWRECLIKGGFVAKPMPGESVAGNGIAQFDLIETMRFTPEDGIALLPLHLERIGASAAALGFAFDRHAARNAIQALCFAAEAPAKLRLVLARSGATALEVSPLPEVPARPMVCAVLPLPVDSGDWRLAHKTSDRGFYEAGVRAARGAGADECLFLRDDGLLTEGCFTNLFVARSAIVSEGGGLLTPPATLGLLGGVLRRSLIEGGRAVEAELTLDDLAGGFFIGNALRGLMPAVLLT